MIGVGALYGALARRTGRAYRLPSGGGSEGQLAFGLSLGHFMLVRTSARGTVPISPQGSPPVAGPWIGGTW